MLVSFDEALRMTLDAATPMDRAERTPLSAADGRVAAEDVRAAADVPPFDRAAMDGYAVRAADTAGARADAAVTLTRVGVVFTGETPDRAVAAGECLEISTGAPVPEGADAVVMVERTRRDGDAIVVTEAARAGQHIGRRGSDMRAGQRVVAAGDALDPARVGAVAATGVADVRVYDRPTVALVSTGNEVIEPGLPLRPGQIYDINRFTLAAIVRRHGGEPVPMPLAGDSLAALDAALDAALAHDVVVFSGGSSVGERDLLRDAIGARGDILYHGIAVKPGKPTMLVRVGRTPVFGMPGNPTSCLSNGYLLLAPFLRCVARLPAWVPRTITLPLASSIRSASDRHQFYTVRVTDRGVEPAFKGSGDITSMADADGYIEIASGTGVLEAGAMVTVTMF
jgi:molybdenum cofactor synthesis domain-containing protein